MTTNRSMRKRPRAAVVLVAVLVGMAVLATLGAALARTLVLQQRRLRLAEQQQQAFWLSESALQRAVHALRKSPDYQGETWRVAAELLDGAAAGSVAIRIETPADAAGTRRIHVEAQFPADDIQPIRYTQEVFVKLPSPGDEP